MDVRREGGPALVADLDAVSSRARWPLFAPLAVEAGAGALFALPLCAGVIRVGVLSLHRREVGRLEVAARSDVEMADAFAHLRARAFAEQRPLGEPAAEVVARRRRFDRDGPRP